MPWARLWRPSAVAYQSVDADLRMTADQPSGPGARSPLAIGTDPGQTFTGRERVANLAVRRSGCAGTSGSLVNVTVWGRDVAWLPSLPPVMPARWPGAGRCSFGVAGRSLWLPIRVPTLARPLARPRWPPRAVSRPRARARRVGPRRRPRPGTGSRAARTVAPVPAPPRPSPARRSGGGPGRGGGSRARRRRLRGPGPPPRHTAPISQVQTVPWW